MAPIPTMPLWVRLPVPLRLQLEERVRATPKATMQSTVINLLERGLAAVAAEEATR
jgi:hypothetical protein